MIKKVVKIIIVCILFIGIYLGLHFFAYLTTDKLDDSHKEKLIIVGHRGACGLAPENTMSAIREAVNFNADFIEIDIQRTKDNVLVVCHDPSIERTTSGKGKLIDLTWEEISVYDVIPTLENVFLFLQDIPHTQLIIEIKEGDEYYPGIEKETLDLIASYHLENRIIIQSFKDDVLAKVHSINPHIRLQKLFWFKLLGLPFIIDTKLTYISSDKYEHISAFNVWYKGLFPSTAKYYKKMGKELKTFNLNEKEMPARLDKRIDGIITDYPNWWRPQIQY